MWKILLAFIVFAAVVMYVLTQAGGDIDMSGEKHGIDAGSHSAPAASAPPASAPASAP